MAFPEILNRRQRRFERQLRPQLKMLYRYAYRLAGNRYDAEDLVQDLLLSLYDKNINLEELENPKTWLLKSLYHKFIDHTRQQTRNPSKPGNQHPDELLTPLPATHDPLYKAIREQDIQYRLNQALDSLNPDQRFVVILHDIEGHKLTEISEILATPVGTLKSRLHRARAELRKSIHREPSSRHQRVTKSGEQRYEL